MKKLLTIVGGLLVAAAVYIGANAVITPTVDATDCSSNAVVRCGISSIGDLRAAYNADRTAGTRNIYAWYGLSSSVINHATYKDGYTTKSGDVVVDGKVVATGATSGGRQYIAGSTRHVSNGTVFYDSPNQTAFRSNTIRVIAFFDTNGQFAGAVMYDCGNPVHGHPVPVPPKPVYACNSLSVDKVSKVEGSTFTFTTSATAKNGAVIKSYNYNFGDGHTQTAGASVTHAYAKAGTYHATVTVYVSVGGHTVAAPGNCALTITVTQEMCDIPGKEQYPKNSPLCVEDKPAITITKKVNNVEHVKVMVGKAFEYEVVVKNTGNVTLKNAVVTDRAPAQVTLLSANVGTVKNNVWTYTIPELKVGESKSFTLKAKYTKYASGTHVNNVCVDTPTVPGSPDACDHASTETYENIVVCDLSDNTIKTIDRSQFDASHMTLDQTKCGKIHVCVIATKTEEDIAKKDFDSTTMTTDVSQCVEVPTPPVVELPHTGVSDGLTSVLGLGSLVGTSYAYLVSRRHNR